MAFFIDLVIESTFPQAQNQSDIESTEFSKYLVDIPSAEKLDEGVKNLYFLIPQFWHSVLQFAV